MEAKIYLATLKIVSCLLTKRSAKTVEFLSTASQEYPAVQPWLPHSLQQKRTCLERRPSLGSSSAEQRSILMTALFLNSLDLPNNNLQLIEEEKDASYHNFILKTTSKKKKKRKEKKRKEKKRKEGFSPFFSGWINYLFLPQFHSCSLVLFSLFLSLSLSLFSLSFLSLFSLSFFSLFFRKVIRKARQTYLRWIANHQQDMYKYQVAFSQQCSGLK